MSDFVQVYRDLLLNPSFVGLPPSYRCVLFTLFAQASWAPCQQDDHGVLVDLLPGQFMCTIRHLADISNVGKNDAERSLKKFVDLKIVRLEVRHLKTVITILSGLKFNSVETTLETTKRQDRDIKEEHTELGSVEPSVLFVKENPKNEGKLLRNLVMKSRKTQCGTTSAKRSEVEEYLKKHEEHFSDEEIQDAIKTMIEQDRWLNGTIKNYLIGIIQNKREKTKREQYAKLYRKNSNKPDLVQRSGETFTESSVRWGDKNE